MTTTNDAPAPAPSGSGVDARRDLEFVAKTAEDVHAAIKTAIRLCQLHVSACIDENPERQKLRLEIFRSLEMPTINARQAAITARRLASLASDASPREEDQLAEIEEMLLDGQGDDDGPQILPDFEEGMSAVAKVEACIQLLEKRRDAIASDASPRGEAEGPTAWLIRKGGYFYRPDKAGYTTEKARAGRYTEADAKAEAQIEPGMKAILADDWPDAAHPAPATVEMRETIARIIDPHSFVPYQPTGAADDVVFAGMVQSSLDDAYRKADRIIAALAPATEGRKVVTTAMIDAAMVEMKNLHPPMRRSECERLLRAALEPRDER